LLRWRTLSLRRRAGTVIELRDGKVWRQEQYDCYA
jgi:hypothetical protein